MAVSEAVETSHEDAIRYRWAELDLLRGLALCGIIFVNAAAIAQLPIGANGIQEPGQRILNLVAHQRFFPIFALLFGVSFGIMWSRGRDGFDRPRVMLLLRTIGLGLLGVVHQVFQPGEALLPFAIVSLAILLPVTWLPTWALLVGALALLAPGIYLGGLMLLPGLTLLGFWLVRSGRLFDLLKLSTARLGLLTMLSVAIAAPALVWQEQDPLNAGFSTSSVIAGLCAALVYCLVILLLDRISAVDSFLHSTLHGTLGSLGRLSLSNYLGATLIICSGLALGRWVDLWPTGVPNWPQMMWACAGILLTQTIISAAFVRAGRQGPAEMALRWFSRLGAKRRDVPLR